MNVDNNIIDKHYNSHTKCIFDFLAEFMTNKFYNVCFELANKYSLNNGLSLSNNYKNILDSYIDTLIIHSPEDEEIKNKMFGIFLSHLYDSYIKHINNNIVSINDFLIIINKTFLPDNYKDDIYIKNQKNLSILFHSLIYNYSKLIYKYILDNLNIILVDRINENAFILKKECIKTLSIIRNDLFENFEKVDDISNDDELIENDLVLNSSLYINLLQENEVIKEELNNLKLIITKIQTKENIYKDKIKQLISVIDVLNKKYVNLKHKESQQEDQAARLSNDDVSTYNNNNALNDINSNIVGSSWSDVQQSNKPKAAKFISSSISDINPISSHNNDDVIEGDQQEDQKLRLNQLNINNLFKKNTSDIVTSQELLDDLFPDVIK